MKFASLAAAASLAALASVGAAHAAPLTGTFSISIYQGTDPNHQSTDAMEQANLANPLLYNSAYSLGTITYTGALNFIDNSGPDTIGAFLNSAGGTITGNTSFFSDTLSTSPFALTTLFIIHGTTGSFTSGTISHDDGITLFDSGYNAVASAPAPTTDLPTAYALNAGAFTLAYVEANGLPADLDVDVPEPASLALLGAGLIGLAAVRRRRRASGNSAAAA